MQTLDRNVQAGGDTSPPWIRFHGPAGNCVEPTPDAGEVGFLFHCVRLYGDGHLSGRACCWYVLAGNDAAASSAVRLARDSGNSITVEAINDEPTPPPRA